MTTRALVLVTPLCALLACGGPSAPATSPEPATPSTESSADELPPGTEPEGAAAAAPAAGGPAASDEDVRAILQLVIDDPELDQHLHLGEAGRFPLQLAGEGLPGGLKLVKATEPVKLVTGPKSKKDAVLVVTELDVQGDKATVRYRYDVEGVRGTASLSKTAHGWELKNSRLVEH
jgi:hypothetical protein